jgi:glycosyltransferase involved in cell wall biosynthesis
MLISIVTPSFNQAEYIPFTLQSVACQTYPHFEHIILDGQSTDGSVEIIRQHAERYPDKIRWLSEPDEGQADAINKGFSMARGEIIAWINSDDGYLHKHIFEEVASAFSEHPQADVIYADVILVNAKNRVMKVQHAPDFSYPRLLRKCFISQPAVFFRRKVIEVEKLDPNLSVVLDYEFWLRLGRKFAFLHVPRLWAFDRNQPGRKILAKRDVLEVEKWQSRGKYGHSSGWRHRIGRLGDKFGYGLVGRLKGVATLTKFKLQKSSSDWTVPFEYEGGIKDFYQQLVKRNQDLV